MNKYFIHALTTLTITLTLTVLIFTHTTDAHTYKQLDLQSRQRLSAKLLKQLLQYELTSSSNTITKPFLAHKTKLALQAALALATQPVYRNIYKKSEGQAILLEGDVTLNMSQSIAEALAAAYNLPCVTVTDSTNLADIDDVSHCVVFVRWEECSTNLADEGFCDLLTQQCCSEGSTCLLVIGRDSTNLAEDKDDVTSVKTRTRARARERSEDDDDVMMTSSPDPEGSQRFNFFLARLINDDVSGSGSIVGTMAPPSAGNVFPRLLDPTNLAGIDDVSNNNNSTSPVTTRADVSPNPTAESLTSAMSEVLAKLLEGSTNLFLQNPLLREGIQENISKAAPALLNPQCSGVMLSVYVPPINNINMTSSSSSNINILPSPQQQQSADVINNNNNNNKGSGWLNKILSSPMTSSSSSSSKHRHKPSSTNLANTHTSSSSSSHIRQQHRLLRHCTRLTITTPTDPLRAKSWHDYLQRHQSAKLVSYNRRALQRELTSASLTLEGSMELLTSALSKTRLDMTSVVARAVEIEAEKRLLMTSSHDDDDDDDVSSHVLHIHSLLAALHPNDYRTAAADDVITTNNNNNNKESLVSQLNLDKHEKALIANLVTPSDIQISWDQIGGLNDVKSLLKESITYPLKYPHLYSEGVAREAVKGVLLFGPPGTGKTMLAKAVATEGGAHFLTVDASSVENKWLGESEKNAKAVFTLARRLAPCVVFLDEVDSMLSSREHGGGGGGDGDSSAHGTLTSVKTTLMSEWDGLQSGVSSGSGSSGRVIVIGSTNRPFDLDEAVLRRFPRRILVDLPDCETRKQILEVTLAENRLDDSVDLNVIAERLEGYTGSDIKEVCREAVVRISHEQARLLDQGYNNNNASASAASVTVGSTFISSKKKKKKKKKTERATVMVDTTTTTTTSNDIDDDDEYGGVETLVTNVVELDDNDIVVEEDDKEDDEEEEEEVIVEETASDSTSQVDEATLFHLQLQQPLRPVTMDDFEEALKKLKKSVSERGRELARVWEWNDQYGEIKKKGDKSKGSLVNMFL